MRISSRRSDDADVIRARLRMLLEESSRSRGWVPEDEPDGPPDDDGGSAFPAIWGDDAITTPVADADEPDAGLPSGFGRHRAPEKTARWDPGRLGSRSLWIAGLLAALVLVAWTWLDRPRVEPAPAAPVGRSAPRSTAATPSVGDVADTSATVVVSVVGAVARPGLVTLPSRSRVAAAVEAAGGLRQDVDPASLNLAAVVADGQQIVVGAPGSAGATAGGTAGAPGGKLDLNTATAAELDALPGVGPVLAQRIVDRRAQGRFTSVDQLDDVPGIGPARAAELAKLVRV